jgi:hypothetical protein
VTLTAAHDASDIKQLATALKGIRES